MSKFSYTRDFGPLPADSQIELLGTVGESRLFRICKARKGTKYVILKTPVAADAMSVEMLRREYELACDLNHPCIARTLGFEETTPVGPAIVMEYVEGENLDEFIASNPSRSRRRALLQDILDGVDYLHHRGILHNDLKPENILVTRTGAARILDFGLSASSDSIYRGCLGGTDGYTAPEILRGDGPAGPASDIYAIGRLMALLFGGRAYRRTIRACTAADPAQRPQDIRALRQRILRSDRMPRLVAAMAAVLLAAGVLALLSARQQAGLEHRIEVRADSLERVQTKRIEERAVSYSNERADSLERVQTKRIETLRRSFEGLFEPDCRKTLEQIRQQQYREAAQVLAAPYYQEAVPRFDSVCRCYPMRADGSIPDELTLVGEVFNACRQRLDSATNSLPSIMTLPAAQRDSVQQIINQLTLRLFSEE